MTDIFTIPKTQKASLFDKINGLVVCHTIFFQVRSQCAKSQFLIPPPMRSSSVSLTAGSATPTFTSITENCPFL